MPRWADADTLFWQRVDKTPTCWIWTGKKDTLRPMVYGTFKKRRFAKAFFEANP